MSEFQRVGGLVPYGEAHIGLQDVEPMRQIAAQGLMLAARSIKFGWNEHLDIVSYVHYFNADVGSDMSDRFLTVQMSNSQNPDFWRLGISCRTFDAEQRHSSKRVNYLLEGTPSELLSAKKEVYLVMGLAHLSVMQSGPQEKVITTRKKYERPMSADDCERACSMLSSAEKRSRVLQGRR